MIGFDLTEQQQELKALARRFSEQEIIPRAREYDEKEIFPRDICEKAFAAGLMNLGVPDELGTRLGYISRQRPAHPEPPGQAGQYQREQR